MKKLSGNVSYLESSDNPLSAEVVMIKRKNLTVFYDCGASDEAYRFIMDSKDNKIVGILYEVDLLDEILNNGTISIKRNVKEPVTVSKNTNLAACLEVLHGARAHMALVTDRENNFLGIVTMEDIINELMKS